MPVESSFCDKQYLQSPQNPDWNMAMQVQDAEVEVWSMLKSQLAQACDEQNICHERSEYLDAT